MTFYEWLNSCPNSNYLFVIFFLGFITNMLYDFILSFINYLFNKSWRVNDLEKIIAKNVATYDVYTDREKVLVSDAHDNYKCHLYHIERRDKFINKFKNFFKR